MLDLLPTWIFNQIKCKLVSENRINLLSNVSNFGRPSTTYKVKSELKVTVVEFYFSFNISFIIRRIRFSILSSLPSFFYKTSNFGAATECSLILFAIWGWKGSKDVLKFAWYTLYHLMTLRWERYFGPDINKNCWLLQTEMWVVQ